MEAEDHELYTFWGKQNFTPLPFINVKLQWKKNLLFKHYTFSYGRILRILNGNTIIPYAIPFSMFYGIYDLYNIATAITSFAMSLPLCCACGLPKLKWNRKCLRVCISEALHRNLFLCEFAMWAMGRVYIWKWCQT